MSSVHSEGVRKAITVIAAVALTVGFIQVRANAGANCDTGKVCVYEDAYGVGQVLRWGETGLSNKLFFQMNDLASSVKNSTTRTFVLFKGKDGAGEKICVAPGEGINDLGTASFNDKASSSKLKDNPCTG